jgi:hypothetical protein
MDRKTLNRLALEAGFPPGVLAPHGVSASYDLPLLDRLELFAKLVLQERDGSREHWRRTFAAAALPAYLGKNGYGAAEALDIAIETANVMTQRLFPNE